ncbi:MAG TPA: hypothetical protein VGN72_07280 [Tepidisphaeraceae bacterium]|jgi:hypothetical protein|nr:hypothetical protein [Tepidisphaeraceae bacterium]
MAEENRPASPQQAPDPTNNYERSHPENEAGQGRLTNNNATPEQQPSGTKAAVPNAHPAGRQINAHETDQPEQEPLPNQPDHSMKDEEPLGWDQAPADIKDPRQQRHPRTEGKGGME